MSHKVKFNALGHFHPIYVQILTMLSLTDSLSFLPVQMFDGDKDLQSS